MFKLSVIRASSFPGKSPRFRPILDAIDPPVYLLSPDPSKPRILPGHSPRTARDRGEIATNPSADHRAFGTAYLPPASPEPRAKAPVRKLT
ncbi:hypothetical protein NL676_002734 [Syzygium grande]|nr:hypothetical protein NL676_002734 [Syzygium grande]